MEITGDRLFAGAYDLDVLRGDIDLRRHTARGRRGLERGIEDQALGGGQHQKRLIRRAEERGDGVGVWGAAFVGGKLVTVGQTATVRDAATGEPLFDLPDSRPWLLTRASCAW